MIDVESSELWIVRVCRQDTRTLCREIQRHMAPGTTIITNEWAAYRRIPALQDTAGVSLGYAHLTVNHSQQFVNPRTHTQNIEFVWKTAKALLVRTMKGWSGRGANTPQGRAEADRMLQTYLDLCWWRSIKGPTKCRDAFLQLAKTIARQYPQS
uniref:Putative isxo2-like transposase domain protein n=1 Tax=Ixodes ricinus TaxID=34613 RepID=A0A147BJK4_IXORI